MKEVIKEIKQKKEFSGIEEKLIEKLLKRNKAYKKFLRTKKIKDKKKAIKSVRMLLRKIITPMPTFFYKKFSYFLKNLDKEEIIEKIIKINQSTKEREKIYKWLIKEIKKINPKKIYDLGCGVNALALYKYGFNFNEYIGFDIDNYYVKLINEFGKIKNLNIKAVQKDITEIDFEINEKNLILALKILDALEEIEIGISKRIINLKGKKIISFSIKSLSGKKMRERYWFEKILKENKKNFKKIKKVNEVFYFFE